MGKKQHQRDKLWMTCTEWRTIYGGKKPIESNKNRFRRLPFYCCSLKFDHTTHPCCTKDGVVFDMENILEYLKKNKINPVTGKKLYAKNLIKLTFHKNTDGEYHCPITYKQFSDNSHIVAVPNTGNVFSMEGITVSNLTVDNWMDPLTNDEFNKKDLIVIQDPDNLDKFNMSTFYHTNQDNIDKDQTSSNIRINSSLAAETLKEVQEADKKRIVIKKQEEIVIKDKINEANYSTGMVSASFTSTAAPVAYINETAVLDDDTVRYSRVKEKGYISLITNFGKINFELFCDLVPKTCENFIKLCESKYYDNTQFHRLIRHFVLQGGDPTGKGTGGQSAWGKPFEDEISLKQSHDARGILSMANLGPNKNTSQFFILLRPAKQLDKKHTIFGKIVGGGKVLDEIEKVESDNKDRPVEPIEIICTEVFVNPFEKVDEAIKLEREQMKRELINPSIDESLKPRTKREEELANLKLLQGTPQFYQSQSNNVAKYLSIPSSISLSDTSSIQSKKSSTTTVFKRPHLPIAASINDDELGNNNDDSDNEYEMKKKLRMLSRSTLNDLYTF